MNLRILSTITITGGLLVFAGCKTPPEVKSALSALDEGYAANSKLMAQYKQLGDSFRERQIKWGLYVNNRSKLDLALRWATTDAQSVDLKKQKDYVDLSRDQLGAEVVSLVNQFRLAGLKEQSGRSQVVFQAGTNNIGALIGAIPAFASAVIRQSAKEQPSKPSSTAFDDYAARVAALRRMNQAISTYLNIDVTVKPEDVHDIAGSVRTLSGN